jgi:Fur family transcriptional regulator, ferric uptake regulator
MDRCNPVELLNHHGIRATRQRIALLESITRHEGVFSAAELASANDSQDVATVYRFLQKLTDAGILREIGEIDRVARYELACVHRPEHAHFICDCCRRVACLSPLSFRDALDLAGRAGGLKVNRVRLEYGGLCKECAEKEYK